MAFLCLYLLLIAAVCSPVLCDYCTSPCATSWVDCGLSAECYASCSSESCASNPDPCVHCILSSSVCDATQHNVNCLLTAYWGSTCYCASFWAVCHTSSDHELDEGGICSLSGGGIAVIAVLSVLTALILALVAFCCYRKLKSGRTSDLSETSSLINTPT